MVTYSSSSQSSIAAPHALKNLLADAKFEENLAKHEIKKFRENFAKLQKQTLAATLCRTGVRGRRASTALAHPQR